VHQLATVVMRLKVVENTSNTNQSHTRTQTHSTLGQILATACLLFVLGSNIAQIYKVVVIMVSPCLRCKARYILQISSTAWSI